MKVLIVLAAFCAFAYGAHVKQLRSTPRLDGRIVGGQNTNIEELPYQLSLLRNARHVCGASIISANWALTAAHCVYRNSAKPFTLRAGSSSRGQGGLVYQVVEIRWHPQYNSVITDYDFALIRVEVPFDLGQPGIQAIQLADEEPSAGVSCIASGWGALWSGGPAPSQLQSVKLPIVARQQCQESYFSYEITDRMICAGLLEGGVDACQGDSGGPLICNGVQVGIVSWGEGCAFANYPGIYANIANVREWVRENSGI